MKMIIKKNLLLTVLMLICIIVVAGCEGPTGADGPKGERGEVGPVGAAGEDGSVMWTGSDAPTADMGNGGDYYLNSTTGEFYGPKDGEGWGNPIMVLMGEDGKDGADGQDGEDGTDGQDGTDGSDGEDGSQIYSGLTTPDVSLGKAGDFYLNKNTFNLYGPKTSSGWGAPINIKGAKGNANVTRYIFPGVRFSIGDLEMKFLEIPDVESLVEMQQSAWLVYVRFRNYYWSLPGYGNGGFSQYNVGYSFDGAMPDKLMVSIKLVEGSGDEYEAIEVVRIEASDTQDLTGINNSLIPNQLNTQDYEAVAEYYNLK